MVYSTRRFVLCLTLCHFVLLFFSPFSIAITSLGEERANLRAFRTFVRFVLVLICWFPLPLGVLEGLRFVIAAVPGLFSYLFFVFLCDISLMKQKTVQTKYIFAIWNCIIIKGEVSRDKTALSPGPQPAPSQPPRVYIASRVLCYSYILFVCQWLSVVCSYL